MNNIKKNDIKISNLKKLKKININRNKKIFNENFSFDNEIQLQKIFCNNPLLFSNSEFDKKIKIAKAKFKNKSFLMYAYKMGDTVSNHIINSKNWEPTTTNNILKALNFYSKKNRIDNKDIYIIDIGANIGWYTFSLGYFGYNIISFEPSKINYYILKKNYCINKELNITLINKGLYNENKICDLFYFKGNQGNGIISCEYNLTLIKNYTKDGEIILTKLENYFTFLKEKNIILIKIDVEGAEGKVFEGGKELITHIHVPFILMEFTPSYLKLYGTNSKQFLQMFINNGYRISPFHFLDKKNYTIKEIFKSIGNQNNLYITHFQVFKS